jgi:hypothetical protein
MKKLLLLAGAMVVGASWLVACAPPSSPSKMAIRKSGLGPNGEKVTETFKYGSFKDEAAKCETGEQKFTSLAELCEGLQNDTLNKSGAEKARAEEFVSRKCEGEFKVVKGEPPVPGVTPITDANFASLVEKKDLKDGERVEGVRVLFLPRGTEAAKLEDSMPLTFHCGGSIERAVETDLAPVALGPGSKILVARYLAPAAPVVDGPKGEEVVVQPTANGKIFLLISCEGTPTDELREIPARTEKIAEKKLKHGQSELEAVLADGEIEGDPTPAISCKKTEQEIAKDALNGIYLLNGADVLLYRNSESPFLKAKTGEDDKLSRVVYRCRE